MSLITRLAALERDRRPIHVAVIGAGQMGSGVVERVSRLPGLRVAGICDLVIERAHSAAERAGLTSGVVDTLQDAAALLREDRTCISSRAEWIAEAPGVDVMLDATGDPEVGAGLAFASISKRRPFVTMNIEADVTVGPLLAWMARRAGTVYTVACGDEPSVLCEMVEFARAIGLEVVCAGKGKNNRLDRTATSESVGAEAAAQGMSARMLASFVDGTKTMAEMAALGNATGLRPDCPGMHGPQANLSDLLRIFVPEAAGGILQRAGAVEYASGDVAPGVFLVVTSHSEPVRRDLAYLKMAGGPTTCSTGRSTWRAWRRPCPSPGPSSITTSPWRRTDRRWLNAWRWPSATCAPESHWTASAVRQCTAWPRPPPALSPPAAFPSASCNPRES
jgi:predicted homoserine dehydrogenase-like protein